MKHTLLFLALFLSSICQAAVVDHWLVAGPAAVARPLFADSSQSLLKAESFAVNYALRPKAGDELSAGIPWQETTGEAVHYTSNGGAVSYAVSYLSAAQWMKVKLDIKATGASDVESYLDGELLSGDPGRDGEVLTADYSTTLHRGKHVLLIRSTGRVMRSTGQSAWSVRATVVPADSTLDGQISSSTDARRVLAEFADAALFDAVASPVISPNGQWAAAIGSTRQRGGDYKKESWLELWNVQTGKRVHSIRPLKGVDVAGFSPDNNLLYYTTGGDKGSTVHAYDLKNGDSRPVLRDVEGLARLVLSPDGKTFYFSADAEVEKSEKGPDHYADLEDRMSDWTKTRKLYSVPVTGGLIRELTTTGKFALDDFAVSREGDQLLFTRRTTRVGRPYYTTEFWTYRVATGEAKMISTQAIAFETRPASFCWLPGGGQVAYVAARFATTAGDTVHNMTQTDLFLLDVNRGAVKSLSRNELFSVQESEGRSAVVWNAAEKKLWVQVVEGGKVTLKRVDPLAAQPVFSPVPVSLPFVDDFALSASGQCVFTASALSTPIGLYVTDGKGKERRLNLPAAELLRDVQLASYEPWSFTNQDNLPIEGWLFYPTDYKPELSHSWPMVVYYYGGVSPRDERFNFTYQWWAANGYFVYVLNPVGCVGYGEAFADKHSNDWGTLASRDIIEGTQKLLKAKPFIDSKMVCCYGGSYGGFITMDVVTKTDLFAAAVSDAGISNLTSYFGAGTWGFTYGDIALPDQFPWTRPDLFVGKSPIFHADKIHTPLLLIHGSADDNVPPTESDQMFVALKLLGREAELLRYPDEDHSIAIQYTDYVHYREMMLQWFDKYVKKQPGAWEERAKELKN